MGKINVYDKIVMKKKRKEKIKEIIHKYPSKTSFNNGIHSLLERANARESADIIYLICDAYRYFEARHSY